MTSPDPDLTHPSRLARAGVWLMLVVVGLHIAAVAIWIGPDNNLRRHVGFTRLSHYVMPLFDQNWSVFAPEADFGNDLFTIRARVRGPGGGPRTTHWVHVTEDELVPATLHHPFPSRTAAISNPLATDHAKTFGALGSAQQQVIGRIGPEITLAQEGVQLLAAATSDAERAAVAPYIRVETAVEYYLSGIAYGIWGDRVIAIQIERSRVLVSNYESRGDKPRIVDAGVLFTGNWRPLHPLDGADRAAYVGYVRKFGIR